MATSIDDITLLQAFQRRDPGAEKALFHRFFRPLCVYAERIIRDTQAAEDIVAESFEKWMDRRGEFQTVEGCKAFLFRVTRNACLNYVASKEVYRKEENRLHYLLRQDGAEVGEDFDTEQLRAELLEEIYLEIEELPDRCRDIFKLLFFGQLTTEEVGQRLGINSQTVRSQKSRAIGLLRTQLIKKGRLLAALLVVALLDS